MNKQTEALKMAIEAWDSEGNFKEAIQSCKEALEQPAQWISVKDRLPEVKSGNAKEFIVVIYSGYTGRSFVTSRHFLNKMELYNEYSDNDFDEVSGWHERTYHLEYDDYYTLVDSCNADAVRYEVTHWMPLPDAPKEQA